MTPEDEKWLPVTGFEGSYEVSNYGQVRSLDRPIVFKNGTVINVKGRVLRTSTSDSNHLYVTFRTNQKSTFKFVHRLVLEAFVGPRPEGLITCHNDGDPLNNHVSNLRWDTPSANALDSVRHGTNAAARRTHCANGHEYTAENTIRRPSTPRKRHCRACQTVRNKRYWALYVAGKATAS